MVLLSVVAVVLLNSGALNGLIEGAIAAQVGRPARLEQAPSVGFEDGALTLDLGPLGIANAEWAAEQHPDFARIQKLQASLRLLPLLRGRVEIPEVTIEGPQLHLARSKDGEVNWPEGDPEGGPVRVPEIENLVIRDATVTYADAAAATEIALALDEAKGQLGGGQDLALHATGSLQDAPLEISATGGSLTELLNREKMSKPAEIEATVGKSRITAQATSFADLSALDAEIEIDAEQTLTEILSSIGVAKADLPPFKATVQVKPGEGGSLVTADITMEGASAHLEGKVDDLAAPLKGFEAKLAIEARDLGPILASYEVPHADQIPSAKVNADVAHDGDRTTVAMQGSVGGDSIELQGGYEGAITAFLNPQVDLLLEGSALGALPAQLGFATRPIEGYRIAAKIKERSDAPSPVNLDVTIENTRVRFDGNVDELRAFKGIDGRVRAEGPDPAAVLELFKLPSISLPPYDVAGQVTWRGNEIKVAGFEGKVGDSDMQGDIALDLGPEPPAVIADLHSDLLDARRPRDAGRRHRRRPAPARPRALRRSNARSGTNRTNDCCPPRRSTPLSGATSTWTSTTMPIGSSPTTCRSIGSRSTSRASRGGSRSIRWSPASRMGRSSASSRSTAPRIPSPASSTFGSRRCSCRTCWPSSGSAAKDSARSTGASGCKDGAPRSTGCSALPTARSSSAWPAARSMP